MEQKINRDARWLAEWQERIARCRESWTKYPSISREESGRVMVGNVDRLSESDFRRVWLQRDDCKGVPAQAYWSYFFQAMVGFYDKNAKFESEQAMLNACAVKARNWLGSAELHQKKTRPKQCMNCGNTDIRDKEKKCVHCGSGNITVGKMVVSYTPKTNRDGTRLFSEILEDDQEPCWADPEQVSPECSFIREYEKEQAKRMLKQIMENCSPEHREMLKYYIENGGKIASDDPKKIKAKDLGIIRVIALDIKDLF